MKSPLSQNNPRPIVDQNPVCSRSLSPKSMSRKHTHDQLPSPLPKSNSPRPYKHSTQISNLTDWEYPIPYLPPAVPNHPLASLASELRVAESPVLRSPDPLRASRSPCYFVLLHWAFGLVWRKPATELELCSCGDRLAPSILVSDVIGNGETRLLYKRC